MVPSFTKPAVTEARLIVGTMTQWDIYREMLHDIFAEKGLPLRVAYEASNSMGILGLVAAVLGVTIFPECVRQIQPLGADIVEIADCHTRIQTVLAWRKDELQVATRNFLRVCGVE